MISKKEGGKFKTHKNQLFAGFYVIVYLFLTVSFHIHRDKELREDRLKDRENLVKKREEKVRMAELEYENKLRNEVEKYVSPP